MYQYPDVPDPMKQIRRRTLGGAAFVTIAGLLLGEVITLLSFGFLPEPRELYEAYVLHLAAFVFVFWWVTQYIFEVALYNMELAFEDCERLREREERRRTGTRPAVFQNVQAMQGASTRRRVDESLTPFTPAHYAEIYRRLANKPIDKRWQITRNDLDVSIAGVAAFMNLTAIYKSPSKLAKHWHFLEWIDGYERGDSRREIWTLNEKGQAAFVQNAGVNLPH